MNMAIEALRAKTPGLDRRKFQHPEVTAKGERRAEVALRNLATLWVNTGTLCNLTCTNCYMESSPTNDRLVYIGAAEVASYLDEIAALHLGTREIGFTGGEPFMNPELCAMLEDALTRGFEVLVLTNAMKPMQHRQSELLRLREKFGARLKLRVSVDHYTPAWHEMERGARRRGPHLLERGRSAVARRIPAAVCGACDRNRRRRSEPTGAVSGNGCEPGCARDHHRLLAYSESGSGQHDVRVPAHDRQTQGRRAAERDAVHAAAVRPAVRHGIELGRRTNRGEAEPSALRALLRSGRRQLQRVT